MLRDRDGLAMDLEVLRLIRGRAVPERLGSESSLLDQEDARGFNRINALRLRAHRLILRKTGEEDGAEG